MQFFRAFREYLSQPGVWALTLLVAAVILLVFVGIRQGNRADEIQALLTREGYVPLYMTPTRNLALPGCADVCLVETYRLEGPVAVPVSLLVCVDGDYRLLSK